jgi:transcriptional regulator with XRE-family HTH domain
MTSFGTLLRDQRVAARKSLRELARVLGLSATYVSCVERNELPPFGAEHVRAAAQYIGCDAIELLRAAMDARATVTLDASATDAHRAAATALAMNWGLLTAQQLDAIRTIVEGRQR